MYIVYYFNINLFFSKYSARRLVETEEGKKARLQKQKGINFLFSKNIFFKMVNCCLTCQISVLNIEVLYFSRFFLLT